MSLGETLRPPPPGPEPEGAEPVDVSIVLPCLNEILSLPHCLQQTSEVLAKMQATLGLRGEVVVADNGSTDGSLDIIPRYGARVVPCPVRGYGNALRWGIVGSRGRYIVMGDADGSYDFFESVPMVEKLIDGFEICMGSRFKGRIMPGAMPWKNRYIGNPILTGVLNVFYRSGLSDAHAGLRAFTREAFEKMNPTSPGMEFASEMVIKATLLDLRRTEVPITLHPDMRDRPPHLRPWQDGWRHLRFLLMLSPLWLYFLPATALVVLGSAILAIVLSTPPGEVARWGRFWIGEHWMTIGTTLLLCGHQSALLGLAATLLGVRERYRRVTPLQMWLFQAARLDRLLLLGATLGLAGLGVLAYVLFVWAASGFGALHMTREMVLGTTLLVLGFQTILSAFLLSVVAGNDADLDVVARRVARASAGPGLPADAAKGDGHAVS